MLKQLLEQKNCFKLICGAGNENLEEVERLVALYAAAGCRFFDLSASEDVLKAAQKGLDFAIPKEEQKDYHFCVSLGTKGDVHLQKARIDSGKCVGCGKCVEVCPQGAILEAKRQGGKEAEQEGSHASMRLYVFASNCIGCGKCVNVCPQNLIELTKNGGKTSLPAFQPSSPLACVELHASDTDENEVDEIWDYLNTNFDGILSLCIGRAKLGDEQILARVKRLVNSRQPYTTIIQADGAPMTGGEDDFKTTLQAVSMGELIQGANLPVYLMLSGGTNSKTAELASLCGINIHGVGVGSFARKIVKEFIVREDFFTNEMIFKEAVRMAKKLSNLMG